MTSPVTGPVISVNLLGPVEARVGAESAVVGGPGRRALVAALALSRGATVPVQHLVDTIWGDDPPATAVTKVQGHVCALRRELARLGGRDAAGALQTRSPGYRLAAESTRTDWDSFTGLAGTAGRLSGPTRAAERATLLRRALGLWRGPACADVRSPLIAAVAVRLEERRMTAVEDLAEALLVLGRPADALDDLQALVEAQPFRERSWELLMRAHLGLGHPAAALGAYREVRHILAEELGIAPGDRIGTLASAIRGGPGPDRSSVSGTLATATRVGAGPDNRSGVRGKGRSHP